MNGVSSARCVLMGFNLFIYSMPLDSFPRFGFGGCGLWGGLLV